MAKRRNFADQLNSKVAFEALRGDKTVQEIAAKHQLHPNQVNTWKRLVIDALQAGLDEWVHHYNHKRTHKGKMCCGRTPFQTMIEGKEIWKEKFVY